MTIEEFATRRWRELAAFFTARFGRRWRQVVARQAGLHPRVFWRWRNWSLVRRSRELQAVEEWARRIGFTSGVDAEIQESIRRMEEFQKAAGEQRIEEERKRKDAPAEVGSPEWLRLSAQINAAMARAAGAEVRRP